MPSKKRRESDRETREGKRRETKTNNCTGILFFKEKGKEYDWKMDMKTIQHFAERDYIEALSYIGILPE